MWPLLLNLTRDECRRTLRSLELEAYSNVMSVFRAQGPLEENRKKILEELRAVLHISQDRHSAEARRVSNDELLATIADKLCGPFTGLGWVSEGRRRVPLLPRGVPQTMYTELADKATAALVADNKNLQKRLDAEKLAAPKSSEQEMPQIGQTAESAFEANEDIYPIAMEDPTTKLWETEIICRKRKPESGTIPDDATPVKNIRNISVNTNQKHVNLSQLYSKFSQPATNKPLGQSKHSYNQVSKVSTSKSNHPTARVHKQRSHKISKSSAQHMTTKQHKKQQMQQQQQQQQMKEPVMASSPSKYGVDYAGPPNTFQAHYAQAVLGKQPLHQADTPPEPTPPPPQKASQFVVKKRPEIPAEKKIQVTDVKITPKPVEGVKLLSSRPLIVTPGSTPKTIAPGKLIATKVIGSIPKTRPMTPIQMSDKMVVVSKPPSSSADVKPSPAPKLLVTSGAGTPVKEGMQSGASGSMSKISDAFTPKGIPATDLKVSAKTFVLNPKSGKKMVVVPARARTKSGGEGQYPVLHLKGMPAAMKLVPVSTQSGHSAKTTSIASNKLTPTTVTAGPKLIGVETIKTANMADIVPVKGMPPMSATKITNPIVRPSSTKGGVIVVQKGATIGKALAFTKNGNDMSKIIMGKNVNQLLQAKPEQAEASKAGNVIVLELNNEQSARATTVSEILESASAPAATTEWDLEATREKKHEDKLNSLHLDLGMSSDSDADYPRKELTDHTDDQPPPPTTGSSGTMSMAARTLLSQLQDEGSSSNDSSFALKPKQNRSDESDALAQAKEKLSEKVEADKLRHRRIDVYSTAITPTDINLDSFSYLEDDDDFESKRPDALSDQLSRLLDEPPANITINKQ